MNLAVFDVDGTLLDNVASEDECFVRALCEGFGLSALSADWESYEHVSDQGIAVEAYRRQFGCLPSDKAVSVVVDLFLQLLKGAHAARPILAVAGASNLMSTLRERGWGIALATGAWRRAAEFKLAAAGLNVAGIPIACAEDGPARAAILGKAIARAESLFAATFPRVVVLGDSLWDVQTARTLSLPFVGVAHGARADRLRAMGATRVIRDFSSVIDSIEHINEARRPSMPLPNTR